MATISCADDRPDLDARPGQAEGIEHLELLDGDRIALADDPLAGLDGHLDRRHLGPGLGDLLGGGLVVDDLGRRHERGGEVAGQLALRAVEVGGDEVADAARGRSNSSSSRIGSARIVSTRHAARRGDRLPATRVDVGHRLPPGERDVRRVGRQAVDHLVALERAARRAARARERPAGVIVSYARSWSSWLSAGDLIVSVTGTTSSAACVARRLGAALRVEGRVALGADVARGDLARPRGSPGRR